MLVGARQKRERGGKWGHAGEVAHGFRAGSPVIHLQLNVYNYHRSLLVLWHLWREL